MDKIKAVIFDVGNVILFYNNMLAARPMSKIIKKDPKKIFRILDHSRSKFTSVYEKGASRDKYWSIMAKQLGVSKIPGKKFDNLWSQIFSPNKKLISFSKDLKKKGYKIALLSNTGHIHVSKFEKKYKLWKVFPVRVYSCDIKKRKPGKEIYLFTLKKLKVKPEETIFIDNQIENVRAAKRLGMHSVLFKNNKQTIKSIKDLLK